MRRTWALRAMVGSATGAAAAVFLLLTAGSATAQIRGELGVGKAERTDAGNWHGTWFYHSRDIRMALWLREDENGVPDLKVRVLSTSPREAFETDWNAKVEYSVQGAPGSFEIRVTERDRNLIKGEWIWDVVAEDWARGERGTFTMYRALDGRQIVVDFDHYEQYRRTGDREQRREMDSALGFEKASKRLVLWEEVPF